jgi:dTDP-4-dehydrorhamnose 3,5-epimerase
MQRLNTALPDVFELRPKIFRDERGSFSETYRSVKFAELGIIDVFVQDNQSISKKGTLRGLHYQLHKPQAKLCRVAQGEALDVAVDIRIGSPTFGKWASVVLSAETQNQIYVPVGFAHGFLALTDSVQFLYKCGALYDPADEHGIIWSDAELAINWGVELPIVSERDSKYRSLAEMPRGLLPRYHST